MKPFASYSTRFKLNFKPKKTDFLKNLHWCCPLRALDQWYRQKWEVEIYLKKKIILFASCPVWICASRSLSYKSSTAIIKTNGSLISRLLNITRTSFPLLPIHTFLRNDSAKNFSESCTFPLLAKILSQYILSFIPKGSTKYCPNVYCINYSIYLETPLDLQYFRVSFLFEFDFFEHYLKMIFTFQSSQ